MEGYSVDEWKLVRKKGRRSLLFLCQNILGYKDVNRPVHGTMFEGLQAFTGGEDLSEARLVNGKPSPGAFKELIDCYKSPCSMWDLQGPRKSLILWPRGHLKTTVCTIAYAIQWILNYPNVRILISSGTGEQVRKFLDEILGHFRHNEMFRAFYPEFVPHGKNVKEFGNQERFTVPSRTLHRKEPTVSTCSVGAVVAGGHFDVIINDDIVDKENVRTPEQIANVNSHLGFLWPLLETAPDADQRGKGYMRGWWTMAGTRYDFCLVGESRITMADWSQRSIRDVRVGDEVVGWIKENGKRYLRPSKVVKCGRYEGREVNRYTFDSGRSVVCTPEHKWWKGPWTSGDEYKSLGLHWHKMKHVRRLIVPVEKSSLFAQLFTEEEKLVKMEPAGNQDVYWFQSESGNYIVDGYCSKNSDSYGTIIDSEAAREEKSYFIQERDVIVKGDLDDLEKCQTIWPARMPPQALRDIMDDPLQGPGIVACTPAGSPVTMADWSDRPIEKIRPGDVVLGFRKTGRELMDTVPSRVKAVHRTIGLVHKLEINTGRTVFCTEDHQWWMGSEAGPNRKAYAPASVGTELFSVVSPLLCEKNSDNHVVIAKHPISFQEVYALETETGNYVVWSYASSNSQYRMNPIPDKSGLVDSPKEIVWVPMDAMKKLYAYLSLHVTVDLAGMEPSTNKLSDNDFTVITPHGFGHDGTLYVLPIMRGRYTPFEVIDLLFKLFAIHPRIVDVKIEKEAHARVLLPFLKREMAKRQKYLPIVEIRRDNRTSKQQRIKGLQPWFRNGSIKFADSQPHKLAIINEIMRFPKYSHDDILDTLADAMQNRDGGITYEVEPMQKTDWSRDLTNVLQGRMDGDEVNLPPAAMQSVKMWGEQQQEESATVDSITGW